MHVTPRELAALRFAAMIVELHSRLSKAGRKAIEGRLRDGLNSGFESLFLEVEMAQLLMDEGFDVSFPDLEGCGRVDLHFKKQQIEGEMECKSLSADAGRKIHRRDFYRFIAEINDVLLDRIESAARDLLVITVADRFPSDDNNRRILVNTSRKVLTASEPHPENGEWFTIEKQSLDVLRGIPMGGSEDFYAACRSAFGEQCHVAGPMLDGRSCLVVVASRKQDDTTKPLLESLKKAHEQLSPSVPGFIAVQFNDIEAKDLAQAKLRENSSAVCNYLFNSRESDFLAAVYFCAYASIRITEGHVGTPAYACWNPRLSASPDGLPFRSAVDDDTFARLIGKA